MTGQDFIKEILLHVPELRGAVDVVRRWLNQAIRDVEGAEDWEFMINVHTNTVGAGGQTSPYDMSGNRMKKPFKLILTHSSVTYSLTLVEPFAEFKKIDLDGTSPVFWGYENEKLHWRPEIGLVENDTIKVFFYQRSEEVDENTTDNWLLNNAFECVKYRVLASAMGYTKNKDMMQTYMAMYTAELDALRERFGLATSTEKQAAMQQQQQ